MAIPPGGLSRRGLMSALTSAEGQFVTGCANVRGAKGVIVQKFGPKNISFFRTQRAVWFLSLFPFLKETSFPGAIDMKLWGKILGLVSRKMHILCFLLFAF